MLRASTRGSVMEVRSSICHGAICQHNCACRIYFTTFTAKLYIYIYIYI